MNNSSERTFTAYGSGALVSANEGEVLEVVISDAHGTRHSTIEGSAKVIVKVKSKEEK